MSAVDQLVVAKGAPEEYPTFTTIEVGPHSFVVVPGVTRITSGHPLAKARPDLFVPVKTDDADKRVTRSKRGTRAK